MSQPTFNTVGGDDTSRARAVRLCATCGPSSAFLLPAKNLYQAKPALPLFLFVNMHYKHAKRYHTKDGLCFQKI